MFLRAKIQLWWLEVSPNEHPNPWSKQRADEGELNKARPRQLDGVERIDSQNGSLWFEVGHERLWEPFVVVSGKKVLSLVGQKGGSNREKLAGV